MAASFVEPGSHDGVPYCRLKRKVEGYSRSQHSEDGGGRRRGQRMDLVGRKENSKDIATYERPEYVPQRERLICNKK